MPTLGSRVQTNVTKAHVMSLLLPDPLCFEPRYLQKLGIEKGDFEGKQFFSLQWRVAPLFLAFIRFESTVNLRRKMKYSKAIATYKYD